MALGRLFGRLFGGARGEEAATPQGEAVEHNGFLIYPQPIRQGGQFLTACHASNYSSSASTRGQSSTGLPKGNCIVFGAAST